LVWILNFAVPRSPTSAAGISWRFLAHLGI
jgi:hypothetical protein